MDAAILFSDILVVPHALGQDLAYLEGEGPRLAPVRSAGEVARLTADRLHEVLAPVYETVRLVRRDLPEEAALIGFAGSPRSEEHTSELQSLMRISYAVFCVKKKKHTIKR